MRYKHLNYNFSLQQDYNTAIAKSTEGPEFARNVCEVTMYFGTLLSKGYNFDQQSTNIKTVTDVNEKEIGKFCVAMRVSLHIKSEAKWLTFCMRQISLKVVPKAPINNNPRLV